MKSKQKASTEQTGPESRKLLNILYRPPINSEDLWDIAVDRVKMTPSQEPVINLGSACNCTDCASCVLAGTMVLMADGSTRAVETFVGGEMVRTMSGVSRVMNVEKIVLGVTRRVLEMRVGNQPPLFISDEHPFWTRFEGENGPYEWWGVYNFNHYLVEKANGVGVNLQRDAIPLRFDIPQTHAHVDGWRHVQPIYHAMRPDTPVYNLAVEDGGSYICNGFVISSHTADRHAIGVQWKGLNTDAQSDQFVASLTSA
ncbi:hypothetical protein G5S34_20045 [Herbaspirillum frisingense]|uniref:hypothetical protein n=1 Tax=Herbaspirillum frisingense TaxID=92645 RepID=UPI0015FF30E8|nr:hypothetical protein [Herbaspirillum frisingense]QNB08819.1 hypothetical protein G5S34_20045 [Herbaspirillum frisingense]